MKPYFSGSNIKSIGFMNIVIHQPGETMHKSRKSEAIIFAVKGRLKYVQDNREFLSNRNNIMFMPKNSEYEWVSEEYNENMMIDFLLEPDPTDSVLCCLNVGDNASFADIFNKIYPYWNFKKQAYDLYCRSGLYEMLAMAEELAVRPPISSAYFEYICPSVEYLETHYSDSGLSNEILARQSNISTVYFRKIFTEKYGMPPMKYLRKMRIDKAKEILKFGNEPIARVAESVGCGSVYSFCRIFRQVTGFTPSDYAKLNCETSQNY